MILYIAVEIAYKKREEKKKRSFLSPRKYQIASERVADAKIAKKKTKGTKKKKTMTTEIKELVDNKECQHSGNDNKKRKRKGDNVEPNVNENTRKKVKQASGTKDKETANDEELVDNKECQDSGNNKKKRKRKDDNAGPKENESTRKKAKQALSTKDKEAAKDDAGEAPSTSEATDKKKKKKSKREKKDAAAVGLEPLSEGTSNKEMDAGENVAVEANKAAEDQVDEGASSARNEGCSDDSKVSQQKKRPKRSRKRVSFSGKMEVFPPTDDTDSDTEKPLVQGKRFSRQEDELVKEAVLKYIEINQLGEEGLRMVLNCKNYPQVKNCWKEIGDSLPWRPYTSVYYRAHILFERSEERKWEPEEYEILRRFHEKHGADWKTLAEVLGKHRFHVKDAWRRVGLPNQRKGNWLQEEYQALFDLVNLDLKMKAFEEKKTKHGMLRDNISWEAISKKLSTRYNGACCIKWYKQLTSSLVSLGLWVDSDDFRLLDALEKLDACCVEDVDWDNLLEHRSGEICRKRWDQMTRHIGGHREKPFIEQVDVLSKRYCPEMLEYKK